MTIINNCESARSNRANGVAFDRNSGEGGGPFEFVHGNPTSTCERNHRPFIRYTRQPFSVNFTFKGRSLARFFFRFEHFSFSPVSRCRRARWRNVSGIDSFRRYTQHNLYLLRYTRTRIHKRIHTHARDKYTVRFIICKRFAKQYVYTRNTYLYHNCNTSIDQSFKKTQLRMRLTNVSRARYIDMLRSNDENSRTRIV